MYALHAVLIQLLHHQADTVVRADLIAGLRQSVQMLDQKASQ